MRTFIYQLISDDAIGFNIQHDNGKDGDGRFYLWIDEFEGGEAYETDLTFINDFSTKNEVLDYIKLNYGEIKKMTEF